MGEGEEADRADGGDDEDPAPAPTLIACVEQALDALGVRFGPARAEVVVIPEGPALVEVGTRIAGDAHPAFHTACAGGDQTALTALGSPDPGRFLADHAVAELAALGSWPPEASSRRSRP
ncbi:hypothetical protein ABZ621_29090 [Streptomyces sp. NPDC007863]|uniref:hypothetical protein n=1 Tax=Streptomyces sp. NPDC007863 TaxID=3154894 RepID=UPI0033C1E875